MTFQKTMVYNRKGIPQKKDTAMTTEPKATTPTGTEDQKTDFGKPKDTAVEFYARITKREDVRELLHRLAK